MVIRELVLPYPNFVLGAIIDPEEANENNYEIGERVNDIYEYLVSFSTDRVSMETPIADITGSDLQTFLVSFKAFVDAKVLSLQNQVTSNDVDITALQNKDTNLQGQITTNKTSITALQNKDIDLQNQINTNKINITTLQGLSASLQSQISANKIDIENKLNAHKSSNEHDGRYYTKDYLLPWLRGGDTTIREDVYIIVESNNGDGTFTYSIDGQTVNGMLGDNGEQIFNLVSGFYEVGTNRIEATINDTLRRSAKSGGLLEINGTTVALTQPEGSGAEITFKYYERIGMTAEYNVKLSVEKPPSNEGKNMWFKVTG